MSGETERDEDAVGEIDRLFFIEMVNEGKMYQLRQRERDINVAVERGM